MQPLVFSRAASATSMSFSETPLMNALSAGWAELGPWNIAVLLFLLINYKCVPLFWHFRVLHHVLKNTFTAQRIPFDPGSGVQSKGRDLYDSVFAWHTVSSHAPILEIDYNLHKSNSTYFSDMDISRTAVVAKYILPGMRSLPPQLPDQIRTATPVAKERAAVILGSTQCTFKKEIQPYASFSMKSRLLAWDEKWLYICTLFVREGKGKTEVLLASAVSKYVVKMGRYTVPPEVVLKAGNWIPQGFKTDSVVGENVDSQVENDLAPAEAQIAAEFKRGLKSVRSFRCIDDELLAGVQHSLKHE